MNKLLPLIWMLNLSCMEIDLNNNGLYEPSRPSTISAKDFESPNFYVIYINNECANKPDIAKIVTDLANIKKEKSASCLKNHKVKVAVMATISTVTVAIVTLIIHFSGC